jgi:hypothetical protein
MTNDEDVPFRPWSFVLRHSPFTIQIGWLYSVPQPEYWCLWPVLSLPRLRRRRLPQRFIFTVA